MNIYTTEAALAVATADLRLVQSLRQAIHNADLTGRQAAAATTAVNDGILGYVVNDPLGYRAYDRPAGYYDGPECVAGYHSLRCPAAYDRFGCHCDGPRRFDPSVSLPPPTDFRSSVQPPWKVLPWPKADAVATCGSHVKPAAPRADGVNVGRTLDLFV